MLRGHTNPLAIHAQLFVCVCVCVCVCVFACAILFKCVMLSVIKGLSLKHLLSSKTNEAAFTCMSTSYTGSTFQKALHLQQLSCNTLTVLESWLAINSNRIRQACWHCTDWNTHKKTTHSNNRYNSILFLMKCIYSPHFFSTEFVAMHSGIVLS